MLRNMYRMRRSELQMTCMGESTRQMSIMDAISAPVVIWPFQTRKMPVVRVATPATTDNP